MITTIHTLVHGFYFGDCIPLNGGTPLPGACAATTKANDIIAGIRNFLAPIMLLIISGVSLTFLLKREMKKFIQFAVITLAVGVFFYAPGIIPSLATSIAGLFGYSGN